MAVTRRGFLNGSMLAGMAAAAGSAAQQQEPVPSRHQNGPKPRSTPAMCLYSDQLLKVGYEEMAGMIRMLGFDGVELMAQPGGHIAPEHADLHLERGIEAMTGSGVDVYAVSTSFTSPVDATLRLALEWGGEMGVPVFRPGDWKFTDSEPETRLIEVQREIAALASMARQTGITMAIHNGTADCVGGGVGSLLHPPRHGPAPGGLRFRHRLRRCPRWRWGLGNRVAADAAAAEDGDRAGLLLE